MTVRQVLRSPGRWPVLAGAVLVLSVPVAVWWMVGDLTTSQVPDPDYLIGPFPMSAAVERLLGAGAVLLVLAAAVALLGARRAGCVPARWWGVLAPLLVAGALSGVGWRVVTAGVVGANIGGGVVLLGGPLVVLALVGVAVVVARARRRRP